MENIGGYVVDGDSSSSSSSRALEQSVTYVVSKCCSCCKDNKQQPTSTPAANQSPSVHYSSTPAIRSMVVPAVVIVGSVLIMSVLDHLYSSTRFSVLMVQVAFDGATGQIKQDLGLVSSRIGSRTGPDLHSMLSEIASRILSFSDSCFSAHSKVKVRRFWWEAKDYFDRTYLEERKKLIAPIIRVNDAGERVRCKKAPCPDDKYLIATILVAADGRYKLPAINDYSDLDSALAYLAMISPEDLEAVKVFWTSRDDIEDFFPTMKRLWD